MDWKVYRVLYTLLILVLSIGSQAAPLAGTDPQYLQEMEASMAKIIREYVDLEKAKLDLLTRQAEQLEIRSQSHDTLENNPITMYRVAETLIEEWNSLHENMKYSSLPAVLEQNLPTPKFDDLQEIARAIFRIQDVYNLSESVVSAGAVPGLDAGSFSARDCFNLGGMAFAKNDHYHSLMWFQEALSKLGEEETPTIDEIEITPLLAVSMDLKGNHYRALQLTREFHKKDNQSEKYQHIVQTYPHVNTLLIEAKGHDWLDYEEAPSIKNDRLDWYTTTEQPKYEWLCRQEYKKEVPAYDKSYTCYHDNRFPYLLLAPAKVEMLRKDPQVLIFRQIIADTEIELIKATVRAKMERSRVAESNTSGVVMHSARESFTGWLSDQDHEVVKRVRARVGIFTNLDMTYAEHLQVSQYGIGGHYGPHYDHATKEDRAKKGFSGSYNQFSGDRIATLMFYLAEPEHGGATAFPYLNLVVKPTKNDAIFWYNLHQSSDGDYDTLHAGCPVLSGAKWVANQWIHERGQEFRRPCGLSEDD